MVRLGDVSTISSSNAPIFDDQIWLLNLDMVEQQTGNIISYNYVGNDDLNGSIVQFDTDNVLYSKLRPNLNKVVIPDRSGFATSEMLPLKPNASVLCREYLAAYLRSDSFVSWAVSKTAGAKMPRLGTKVLLDKEIPLPPLEEQRRIAALLDKVSALITKHRTQLDKLNLLVKARFVEMFGDPLRNTKGWPCLELTKACKAIFGGGTPSKNHPEYFMGIIPWVSPKDMKQAVIGDSTDHITEEAVANSTTNLIPTNSVLMVIRSGILKHTLPVAINSVPVTINQDMKAFVPDSAVLAEFLMHYFKAIEPDVLAGVRGVTADNIDFKEFQKRLIIVPPVEVQLEFANFVKGIDKTKLTIQHSLDKLETLKKALMQQYFG